jgi:hypothetical protein
MIHFFKFYLSHPKDPKQNLYLTPFTFADYEAIREGIDKLD